MASYFQRESADTKLSRFGLSMLADTAVVAKLEYTRIDLQVISSCMLQKASQRAGKFRVCCVHVINLSSLLVGGLPFRSCLCSCPEIDLLSSD
jgi:hypothetical protein